MLNKINIVQIILLSVFIIGLFASFYYTDVYFDVKENIVETVCLSCIKMDPAPSMSFTFETKKGSHPDFILDNLTKGPIFLAYRKTICDGCDIMDPLVEEVFNVDFGMDDHEEYVDFRGQKIYFRHINVDTTTEEFKKSYTIYGGAGVPMFVAITLAEDNGFIKPYYRLEYGTLGEDTDSGRKEFLRYMMIEAINYYEQYSEEYNKEIFEIII